MKKYSFIILFMACGIMVLGGCASTVKQGDMPKDDALLEPQSTVRFSDIPAPAGFNFIPVESYAFESSGVRVGLLRYQGKADIEQVVDFYKDQMPLYNWNLLNAVEYGERLLNFEREQETCIINICPKGRNITITVSLGPKSGTKAKKADKPVK